MDPVPINKQRTTNNNRPDRPLEVVLLFDVEDIFSPSEVGNDDSIQELATILTEEGLRGTFRSSAIAPCSFASADGRT